MTGNAHLWRSENPFDLVAQNYDETFEESPVTQSLRRLIQNTLLRHFAPGEHVLELNCGTGTDAIALAGHGIRVTATDDSQAMLDRASRKLSADQTGGLVGFERMGFEDLHVLGDRTFDGVFSNFGGLNCAENLPALVAELSKRVRPGGAFIACVMNKTCVWEMTSFLARGRLSQAGRRLGRDRGMVGVGGRFVPVTYYSPGSFSLAIDEWFAAEESYGVSIFSPSSNSGRFVNRFPRATRVLVRCDSAIRRLPLFASMGDHFVHVARRRIS